MRKIIVEACDCDAINQDQKAGFNTDTGHHDQQEVQKI